MKPRVAPILILAMGNPSRGDDAFGPLMAERLQAWLDAAPQGVQAQVSLISELQLSVEHVLDLQGRQALLFIDAHANPQSPLRLAALQPASVPHVQSHQCTPAALLALYAHHLAEAPAPAWALTAPGHSFELGAPPSPAMQAALQEACAMLHDWLTAQLTELQRH
jgi:hydrogenase maturation protease